MLLVQSREVIDACAELRSRASRAEQHRTGIPLEGIELCTQVR